MTERLHFHFLLSFQGIENKHGRHSKSQLAKWTRGHSRSKNNYFYLLPTSYVCVRPPLLLSLYLHHYEVNIFYPHFTRGN